MRPAILMMLAIPLLAGCATGMAGPPIPVTTHSLLDDYVLVHGMAKGTVLSAGLQRDQLFAIIRLDRAAIAALSIAAGADTDQNRERARQAIEALAAYTAAIREARDANAAPPATAGSERR